MSTPGSPARDPAGHRAADPSPTPEPVERQAGRDPEAANPGEWPQQRIGVGRHRVRVADQPDRLRVGEEREPPDRPGHQRREPLPVRRQRPRGMLPRHAVLPARPRIQLVPAEDHPAVLALAVDEVVRVAEAGHVLRQLRAGHGLERDVLVIDRRGRDEPADHRRDLWRPHPGGVDDELGGDGAGVGQHGRDLAPGRQLEPRHADAASGCARRARGPRRPPRGWRRAGRGDRHRPGGPRRTATRARSRA